MTAVAKKLVSKKLTKRQKLIQPQITNGKVYKFDEAIAILQSLPKLKFVESIDVSVNLGVDPKKSDQVVRGSSVLPNGTGKNVTVAVFTQGAKADEAKAAGADFVGMKDLADDIKAGKINFNVVIASPDAMGIVGTLGPVLGPRGLMPNPKVGTVTVDVASAVKNAKGGQVRFRTDKQGIVHCSFGKSNFDLKALKENLETLLADIKKLKPSTSKGVYLKKITISTTMGPGLILDPGSLSF
jgi:large subunit ribosomal protein L1